ncbi:MAG: hypothetical protein RSB47_05920 [Ruthenibacterium sp.]
MGDRNIKKEAKKPKKSDKNATVFTPTAERPVVVQPELIKKAKKIK